MECAAGCGHRLYSDQGPFECPCYWPATKVVHMARRLQGVTRRQLPSTVNGGVAWVVRFLSKPPHLEVLWNLRTWSAWAESV